MTGREKKSGFTLLELMAAVVILGIISSVAYMNMHRERRKGELKGAVAQVQMIVVAEQLYYMNFRSFRATTSTATTNTLLGLKLQETYFKNYRVTLGGSTYTVRVNGGNGVYTFDASGVRTGCVGTDCV